MSCYVNLQMSFVCPCMSFVCPVHVFVMSHSTTIQFFSKIFSIYSHPGNYCLFSIICAAHQNLLRVDLKS